SPSLIDGLDSILVERCPDLLVVLDAELKVVRASAGLRAAVAQVEPGMEFARTLDEPSRARFEQAMALERDATQAFPLEVRHRRHRHPLACAALDVDGFKRINDNFGHAAGDALLQHIGTLLRATLRASDLPARIGGDEFVALMPDTSVDGAVITSERLLGRLAQHPLEVLDQSLTATVSIGVASAEGCSSLEELLARADAALYRAKKEGKSR